MNKLVIILFLCTLSFSYLFGDNSSDAVKDATADISIYEQYEETLEFGIEKEVVEVLKILGNHPKKDLLPLIEARYQEANLFDTKASIIDYYSNLETVAQSTMDLFYHDLSDDPINVKHEMSLIQFMGVHGQLREGKLLIELLEDDNKLIYLTAADALSKIKNKELVPLILKRLQESDTIDEKYLDNEIKSKLVLSFGENQAVEAVDYLKDTISDYTNDKFVIMYGMVSLGKIQDIESIPVIEKNLSHDDIKIQEYAAYALSQFKNEKVLPIFKRMLKHNRDQIRIFACQGIVLNKDINAIKYLIYKFKNDPSQKVRNEALKSLVFLEEFGIGEIKSVMNERKLNYEEYSTLGTAVKEQPTLNNVNFLINIYQDADKKGKEVIARSIVTGTSNLLDPIIKELLKNEDYLIRLGALKGFYNITDSTLSPFIREISVSDPSPIVRKSAKNFLDLKQ